MGNTRCLHFIIPSIEKYLTQPRYGHQYSQYTEHFHQYQDLSCCLLEPATLTFLLPPLNFVTLATINLFSVSIIEFSTCSIGLCIYTATKTIQSWSLLLCNKSRSRIHWFQPVYSIVSATLVPLPFHTDFRIILSLD